MTPNIFEYLYQTTMTAFQKGKKNFMYGNTITYDHDTALEDKKKIPCMAGLLPTHKISF